MHNLIKVQKIFIVHIVFIILVVYTSLCGKFSFNMIKFTTKGNNTIKSTE